jgi:L-threonylcarbamoyladenylate synthase
MPIDTDLSPALAALAAGKLAAIPTETVYGLAADALDAKAVLAIFQRKERPTFDPLIVHIHDISQAEMLAEVSTEARNVMEHFWPGPLTLVLPRRPIVPDLVSSGLPTVALRMPAHPLALELLRRLGRPLAAPSANRFGRISPTCADHVREQFPEGDFPILDGGPCQVGVESTVFALQPQALILRPGAITAEMLEGVIGRPVRLAQREERSASILASPGLLASHYAPRTSLVLRYRDWDPSAGLLAFDGHDLPKNAAAEVLSPSRDLTEAAHNLFAALRRLDAARHPRLMAELVPDQGLGRAINDRLRRAAGLG